MHCSDPLSFLGRGADSEGEAPWAAVTSSQAIWGGGAHGDPGRGSEMRPLCVPVGVEP